MPRNIYSNALGVERTSSGCRLVVSRVVDAPAATVWSLLTDTARWPEWGPSVAAVDCPTRRIADGTTGRVRIAGVGVWVPFEVDSFAVTTAAGSDKRGAVRKGRWTWTVARLPATGHRVESVGDQCRVSFEVPLLAAGYVTVCQRALETIARLAVQDAGDASLEGDTESLGSGASETE